MSLSYKIGVGWLLGLFSNTLDKIGVLDEWRALCSLSAIIYEIV